MKVKVTIEEFISQTFEVEVSSEDNAFDEIKKMYKDEKLVLDDASLIEANVMIHDQNGDETDWNRLV